ncbi:MAG: hypothetical protein Q7T20_17675 [Saprospiraceae bacterium]|nr:hypothetical protein [Saprospiraceae bacterium]
MLGYKKIFSKYLGEKNTGQYFITKPPPTFVSVKTKRKKMSKITTVLLLLSIFLLSSCARIYSSHEAKSRASRHQIIAIAPPKVSIAARKKVDAEALKEQEKTESINFQKEMYGWLLKRKMQKRIMVEIQDVEITNTSMKSNGQQNTNMSPP